jgi:hypothetical protein
MENRIGADLFSQATWVKSSKTENFSLGRILHGGCEFSLYSWFGDRISFMRASRNR